MNVCIICQSDGVLNALNHWYCIDHVDQGLADVAAFVSHMRGWDQAKFERVMNQLDETT